MAEENKALKVRPPVAPLRNPGMIEMQKVVLQLYHHRLASRQDIVDLIGHLQELVENMPDKIVYPH